MDENLKNICLRIFQIKPETSNLRLQKLLYFIQVFCLIEFDRPAFNSQIEAWPYGPVVPEAYFAYKREKFNDGLQNKTILDSNIENAITRIIDIFSECSDSYLVGLTHSYDIWQEKINNIYNRTISLEEIREFHLNRLNTTGRVL